MFCRKSKRCNLTHVLINSKRTQVLVRRRSTCNGLNGNRASVTVLDVTLNAYTFYIRIHTSLGTMVKVVYWYFIFRRLIIVIRRTIIIHGHRFGIVSVCDRSIRLLRGSTGTINVLRRQRYRRLQNNDPKGKLLNRFTIPRQEGLTIGSDHSIFHATMRSIRLTLRLIRQKFSHNGRECQR